MAEQCDAFQQCVQPQSTPEWFTLMVIVLSAVVVILLAVCAVTWVRDRRGRAADEAAVGSVPRKTPDRVEEGHPQQGVNGQSGSLEDSDPCLGPSQCSPPEGCSRLDPTSAGGITRSGDLRSVTNGY